MTDFRMTMETGRSIPFSAALGTSTSTPLTEKDVGKAVKLGLADTYVLCADGDAIEGFLVAAESHTINGGFGIGSIQNDGRYEVIVGTTEAGTISIGDLVVLDSDQPAIGVVGVARVKTQAIPAAGLPYWRVISIVSGTGASGDSIIVEKFI